MTRMLAERWGHGTLGAAALAAAFFWLLLAGAAPAQAATVTVANLQPVEGVPVAAGTQVATFTGLAGVCPAYTATITWDTGVSKPGTATNTGGGLLDPCTYSVTVPSGQTHTYADEGPKTVKVDVASPGDVDTGTAQRQVTVADAPINAGGGTIDAVAGTAFNGVVAGFVTPDPNATAGEYTVGIQWGDGTSSTGTVTAVPGGFAVSGSHTYMGAGTPQIGVLIQSTGGSLGSAVSTARVAAPPPPPSGGGTSGGGGAGGSGPPPEQRLPGADVLPPSLAISTPRANQGLRLYRRVRRRGRSILVRQPLTLSGRVSDQTGVSSVQIAIRQVKPGGCRWFDGRRLRGGACSSPRWLRASVLDFLWTYTISTRASLPPGRYEIRTLASDFLGLRTVPSSAAKTIRTFRLI